MPIVLNAGQIQARDNILDWLCDLDPSDFHVLSGWAGTGKSTMLQDIFSDWPDTMQMLRQVNPAVPYRKIFLTATTNKACRALEMALGLGIDAKTVHSHLGLKVKTSVSNGKKYLAPSKEGQCLENQLIIIDEASMIDQELLDYITTVDRRGTKILFIGDPTQLTPVKSVGTPVFEQGWNTSYLTEIMRQAKDNPIQEATNQLREFILNPDSEFPKLNIDGVAIRHMGLDEFSAEMLTEFSNPDWTAHTSKAIAWKNDTVKNINEWVRENVQGDPKLQIGDIAVVNRFQRKDGYKFATDAIVLVDSTRDGEYEIRDKAGKIRKFKGTYLKIDDAPVEFFVPNDFGDYDKAIKLVLGTRLLYEVQDDWADIRAAYACTIHKSQGSSFDRVFLDLSDFNARMDLTTLARLLYVAVSRARYEVVLTGDINGL